MARISKTKKLRASILDLLLDDKPEDKVDMEANRHHKLKNLRISVRRDLENLLNTRYRIIAPPEEFKQLKHSLLNYGLPDLATVNMSNIELKREFTDNLETIIKNFEPRFKSVQVTFKDNPDKLDRTLQFRIDATLFAEPEPEVIIFDSILEPVTRSINVKEAGY